MTEDQGEMENGPAASEAEALWRFSVRLYEAGGVEDAALALQDEHGLDVNLLLLCCFLGLHGVRATRETIATLDQHARAWRAVAVEPLRGLRRRLKQDVGTISAETAAPFREQVKALELEAERLQQEMLFRTLERLPGRDGREAERAGLMRINLTLYLTHAQVPRDAETRERLECLVAGAIDGVLARASEEAGHDGTARDTEA
ncbi:TIGR02444 family protein [Marivibrio halodurans]|uniref:TIGR02444 family protein n=1 Tax=Marivibrio halodurans TaxID=2039722 RepID=A0A8J7V2L3_9PROT|nr:TIGR02444 family protein [Marivibrio halodurans]MBP5857037.1 TIGR02444 family protein [Marivibrio halodurans]